jgi:AP-4 complex subunit epsilon-1
VLHRRNARANDRLTRAPGQVLERRLPKTYDYPRGNRGLPAPFIQVKLLRLMRLLGAGDAAASAAMYGVVGDALRAADNGTNMGHAVVAEAVKTAAALVPSAPLLASAADSVAKLLRGKSNNLKYVGIDALCDVVVVSPAAAAAHQFAVIDCLEDPDESLRRKTLELLYRMASPANVEVIAGRMLGYLRAGGGADSASIEETCARVAELAERYAPSNEWFIGTMNAVFELGGPLVRPGLAHGLCRLLAEGSGGEDPAGDAALRASACAAYAELLAAPKLPAVLLGVCFWALGEFGVAAGVAPPAKLQDLLADALETHAEAASAPAVQAVALTALAKIVSRHGGPLSPAAASLAATTARSRSTDLAQRAAELQALAEAPRELAAVAYPQGCAGDSEPIDPALPFLNGFVADALARGASPYQPPEARTTLANPVSPAAAAAADAAAAAAAHGRYAQQPAPMPALSSFTTADDLDVFGLSDTPAQVAARLPQQSPPASPAVDRYSAARGGAAASPREDDIALNVSGVGRKWGAHVTLAANPPPPRTPAGAGGADLLDGFGLAASPAPPPPAPPPTPAAASPAQPPVDPQKARLAAALFGGGGAASTGAPSTPFAARAARAAAGTPGAPARQEVDLLGGLVAPPPTPAGGIATPQPQRAVQQPPRDPFAALESLAAPTPAAPAPFNFDALLGPAPPAAAQKQPPSGDAFSLLSLGGGVPQPQQPQQPANAMAALAGQMQRLQPAPPTALGGGSLPPKGAPPPDPFAKLFS